MSAGFGRRGEPPAVVVTLLVCMCVCVEITDARHFSSQWAAHIEGGTEHAQRIAQRHGFTFLGEIFPDCYHLQHSSVARRSISPSNEHHDNLLSEREVKWARQQKVISRSKRDFTKTQSLFPLNDPKWTQMWYLNRGSGLDMSVQEAWNEGVTGKGVVVTILDDGLERDHPDLLKNYDPQASYDVNNHDDDPMPRYDLIDSNRHGTRCAGEVAAVANNSLCSVGIAYNANIGGVRMLDGDVTDAVEARSLSLNPQHIDIYSASWGPDDDGKTVDGPGELAVRAFMEGVTKGRGGRGSIFIWASGNGGRDHDNCNCDGYTNSIWTLSISSATEKGFVPWYSEACSSTLATTYSSGSNGEKQVITTDLHRMCTVSHSGTSASAPLAAGICALALEANPQLTWRDMQHIVVATARPANLKAPDWTTNGVGRNVSHSFGYGLMDAAEMVKLSRKWRTVPEQQRCEVIANHSDKLIPAKSSVKLTLDVKECPGVNYLEHVQAKISLNAQRRGDLQIHLTSPSGTKSTLLARRPHDVSRVGFQQWPFMSVHTWGESPVGVWHLEIHNEGRFLGQLQDWTMMFYGTESAPMSAIDHEQRRPSTIKMATGKTAPKVPADNVTGAPDSSGAPPDTAGSAPKTHANQPSNFPKTPPPEVSEVFNTVRDHDDDHGSGTVTKNHGPFDATSSADNLICRRSANICLGLCLIFLFYVRFLFDNYIELPVIGDKYGGDNFGKDRNLNGDRKKGNGKDRNLELSVDSEICCKNCKEKLNFHSYCKIGRGKSNYLKQPIDADSYDNLGRRKLNSDSNTVKCKGIYRYLEQTVDSDNFYKTNRDKYDDGGIGLQDKEGELVEKGDCLCQRKKENEVKKEKTEGMNERGLLFIDDDVFCQRNIGGETKVKVSFYEVGKQRRTNEEENRSEENLVINDLQLGIETEDLSFGIKLSKNMEGILQKCMNKKNYYSRKIESLNNYFRTIFQQNCTDNNVLDGNFLYSRNRTDILSKLREQKLVNNFQENHLDYIFDMSFGAFYTLSDSMKEIYGKTTKNKFDSIISSSLCQSSFADFHDLDRFGEIFLKSINEKHPRAFLRQRDQETHKFIDFVFDKNLIDARPAYNENFKHDELKLRNIYHCNSGDFGNPNCFHKTYLSSQNNISYFENKSNNLELILMLMDIALLVEILNKIFRFYKSKQQNIYHNNQDDLFKLINQSTSSKEFYKCNIQDISHSNCYQDELVKYFDQSISSQESDKEYFQVYFYFSDNELEKPDRPTNATKFHKSNFQNRLIKSVQSTSKAGFEICSLNPLGNFTSFSSDSILNCYPNNNNYSTKVNSTENTKNNYLLISNFRNILDEHCQKNDKSREVAESLEIFYCLTCIVLLNGCKIGGFCRRREIVPSQNTSKISHSLPKQTRSILL